MSKQLNRRQFIGRSLQVSGGLAAAIYAGNGWAAPSRSPNERLNLAGIGVGNKGRHNVDQMAGENWVAMCDIDENFLNSACEAHPQAKKFRDYREMFDKEANNIDAVVVSTADHTHAPATSVALQLKKHVYCEKPLTHTVAEARAIRDLAAQAKVATQMGTQIHAEGNYRRVVELVRGGAIGKVSEVYCWCNKGWSDGRFQQSAGPAPATLDWDLWLGPAKSRPYCDNIHPANWRRFWEFGAGTFGDMACHVVDLPFWALELDHPTWVECEGPEVHPDGAAAWFKATYGFNTKQFGEIKLHWADGGQNFDFVKQAQDGFGHSLADWGLGILFVGADGMLVADYGQRHLLPKEKFAEFKAPEPTIPDSIGHWNEWLQACRTGSPTTCNFDYASKLTETVLLGIVAFRSGKKFEWDAQKLEAKNCPEAQAFISKEYRKGFEVVGLKSV